MAEPFVGEIRLLAFPFAPPYNWALCDGSLLPISQHSMLYAVIGNTYGGDGITTFAVPDLRGRTPVHFGNNIALGQQGGSEEYALSMTEMPLHVHQAKGSTNNADTKTAAAKVWANSDQKPYAAAGSKVSSAQALVYVGKSQGHPNMQPSLVINYCIALEGYYPVRP